MHSPKLLKPALALALCLVGTHAVHAVDYDYVGEATFCSGTCDSFAALGGPGNMNNPTPSDLTGTATIATSPSSAFTFADVDPNINFEVFNSNAPAENAIFAPDPDPRCDGVDPGVLCNPTTANPLPLTSDVAALREGPEQGLTTGGTTDANNDLASGTLLLEFIVPPFNDNGAWAILDLATGAAQVCLFFPTAGCISGATEALIFAGSWSQGGSVDTDGDGVTDDVDNCIETVNPAQRDTDGDGHGNACDGDFDQNCVVNPIDLGSFRSAFFTASEVHDLNGDGVVNPIDLGIFRSLFFGTPGPSPAGSLCNP